MTVVVKKNVVDVANAFKRYAINVLLFLCLATTTATLTGGASCRWSSDSGNDTRNTADCTLRVLDPNALTSLASSLDGANKLRIRCSEVHHFESTLNAHSWQRLPSLHELHIHACKVLRISGGTFQSLIELKKLTIQTFNAEWGAQRVLELAPGSLSGLRELHTLEIVESNVLSLPAYLLCDLDNLQSLNLTGNRIRDILDIGLTRRQEDFEDGNNNSSSSSSSSSSSNSNSNNNINDESCRADVRILDLSRNELTRLPNNGPLAGLRQLQELHLQRNSIAEIDSRALVGLTVLRIFNASYNSLASLPEGLFGSTRELREIHLAHNGLGDLPKGIFTRLEWLLVLNLAGNRLDSNQIDETSFLGLIRLIVLDLSYNLLTRIDARMFKDLLFLHILDLRNNSIDYIERNAFLPLYNLHTLELSDNKLRTVGAQLLNGLFVLNRLTLSGNSIASVDPVAFRNCSDLKELDLSGNGLTSVPEAIRDLAYLKTLDLGENRIASFHNGSFRNLHQLTGLRLIGNDIGNLSRGMLWDLPNLQILNLARNKVQHIDMHAFERNIKLEAIRLDGNFLSDINGIFTSITSLLLLNLSENHIEWFDYAFIPGNLKWLDIHGNFIEKLDNYYKLRNSKVKTLDASHNRITELTSLSVPDSVELLFINNNYISIVHPNTFTEKVNLTRVDMYANMIETMELTALLLTRVPETKALPEFYIGDNPFYCNCSMDWLPAINNQTSTREYPRVMDLDNVRCRTSGPRGIAMIPASTARSNEFLCRYEAHCFALCHCCDYDACDCEMTCPNGCKCYNDRTWSTNAVDCSGLGVEEIPRRIPMDATEVYLDGNVLRELLNHVFIGRKNMRVLYVNGSGIESIQNRTFNGLNNLQILHLEDNRIRELKGFEFERLSHLRELYLQNNQIGFIGNLTFLPLRSLEILRLSGNRLVTFPVWQVTLNARLVELSLGNNPWSCRCKFLQELSSWVSDNAHKVVDTNDVWCYYSGGDNKPSYRRRLNVNETACSDYYAQGGGMVDFAQDYLTLVAATFSALLVLLIVVVLAFVFRGPVCAWAYSKYGLRFQRTKPAKAGAAGSATMVSTAGITSCYDINRERLYDCYVSYSPNDEDFILHSLAAELEHGPTSLRLCLHHRDLPCMLRTSTPGPTILEAVDASRRTLIVLTRNFLQTEWSRFELRAAFHEALRGRANQLIVVQAANLSPELDRDPELRPYLRNAALTLTWGEKRFWERLKYAIPPAPPSTAPPTGVTRNTTSNIASCGGGGGGGGGGGSNGSGGGGADVSIENKSLPLVFKRNINSYAIDRDSIASRKSNNPPSTTTFRSQRTFFKDTTTSGGSSALMLQHAPPAYSCGTVSSHHQQPPPSSPQARLTVNHVYRDAVTVPAGSLAPTNPMLATEDHTRPLSEHIYSSIDSDYSTLERSTWRQQQPPPSSPPPPPSSGQAYLV
ncbi:PREDICTED: slit homolog 2 protein-like [Polistes dominula]|uniref:Slit homolog 2 protein-like n=1 Tax=Polistes dominula TaxID=743375 RepID=A0ABM1J3M2_POLDO|nr:PREDICTED: slit homolog 2 protein-like [Polistes dominula]